MSSGQITAVVVVIVVVLLVIAAIAWARGRARRERLRSTFGSEYDVAVDQHGSHTQAERELEQRQARHEQLGTRPLDPQSRVRYLAEWSRVQSRFVDRPNNAVAEADELIRTVMVERGYPVDSYDQMALDLSVEHANALSAYRTAHDLSYAPSPSTEDLRSAMVNYRRIFAELLEAPDDDRSAVPTVQCAVPDSVDDSIRNRSVGPT